MKGVKTKFKPAGQVVNLDAKSGRPLILKLESWRLTHGGVIWLLIIMVAAGVLRFYDLGGRDLWIDEANSVLMARDGVVGLVTRLKLDSSPPLYYLALNIWADLFGNTEAALRLLSVISGLLLVASVFITSRQCFGKETAIIAALVIAIAPIQIFYSQQARMYGWLSVLALWSFHLLWRYVEKDSKGYLIGYGFVTLAALYTHNYGLYLLPAHAIILLFSGGLKKRLANWLAVGLCITLGYMPWVPILLSQLKNETHYSWYAAFWRQFGPFGAAWRTLQSFTPTGMQPPYVALRGSQHFGYIASIAMGFLVVLAFFKVLTWGREEYSERKCVLGLGAFLLIPLSAAITSSVFLTPNYVPGRCDQLVFPVFVILAAYGMTRIRSVALRIVVVAGIVVLSAIGLNSYYGTYPRSSDRAISEEISRCAQAGDAVLCTSLTRASVEYYLCRFEAPIQIFSYPRDTALHLGSQDNGALLQNPQHLQDEAIAVELDIIEACGNDARVFLVLNLSAVNKYLHDHLVISGHTKVIEIIDRFIQAGTGQPIVLILLHL